jgi:exosortase A
VTQSDRNFVVIVVLSVIPIAIYWDSMSTMARLWSMDAYQHGYLIPFVSMLLLWRDRSKYGSTKLTGSWIGAGLLGILVALWIVAEATSVQLIEQLSVVLMVSAFALTVLGWRAYQSAWFPLAFLLFAVPIGDAAIPYLMDSTATFAVVALQMLGVPALREGMLVSLPEGTFEVVEACSGFNYLTTGVALGVLVAHLMFKAVWKQVFYVAAVVGVFVFINGLRAFVIMLVGSMSNMQLLVGREHIFFGWVLFLLAMALMYWVAEKYSDLPDPGGARASR